MALPDMIVGAESGNNPTARNPRSSAGGAGQFIDGTWLDVLQRHRPDLVQGRSRAELLALKDDPILSKEMVGAYAGDNGGLLQRAGLPVTDGTTYLAHFAGPQGAIGLLRADPTTPASAVLGDAAMRANPFLAGMTAGDVAAWADRKMGGAPMSMAGASGDGGASTPPQAGADPAAAGSGPGAPLSLAPPGAGDAPQQPQAQQERQAAPWKPIAVDDYDNLPKTPPMLLPQRPRVDLAQIRQFAPLRRGYG